MQFFVGKTDEDQYSKKIYVYAIERKFLLHLLTPN